MAEGEVVDSEIVESIAGKTLAAKRSTTEAPSSGYESASAGHHTVETTGRSPSEMHSGASKAATSKMHSATAKPAVHATESTSAVECYRGIW